MNGFGKSWLVIFFNSFLLTLTSCQALTGATSISTISPSPVTIATLQSYPTPLSVFEYQDQVTDGRISLSINGIDTTCHEINEPFQIKLTFKNLTDTTIKLPNDFLVAANRGGDGGNISPFITASDGGDVYSLADTQFVDIFGTPSSSYDEIQPNGSYGFVIDYIFPELIAQVHAGELQGYVTPTPGSYYIRFVYSEPERGIDTWYGSIGSNRMEICILN